MTRVECVNKVIQQSGDRQDKSEESKLRVKSSVAVKRFEDTKNTTAPDTATYADQRDSGVAKIFTNTHMITQTKMIRRDFFLRKLW